MEKTKKQHYVAVAYLEAFARDGQVNVFDKATGAQFRSPVRDVASQRFFYDIPEVDEIAGFPQAIEKFFQPFESAAAVALHGIRSSLQSGTFTAVTEEQRIDLSLYLALQMLRTPEAREWFAQLALTLHKETFLAWANAEHPEAKLRRDSFELTMSEDHQLRTHALHLLDHELRDRIAEIVFCHAWVILENRFTAPFICSDHPACHHGTVSHPVRSMQGLGSLGAEVLFPLSPAYLLLISERRAFPKAARLDGQRIILEAEANLEYYNHWQVRHSFRFLYSIDPEFSLARSMLQEFPELANPRNVRIGVKRHVD